MIDTADFPTQVTLCAEQIFCRKLSSGASEKWNGGFNSQYLRLGSHFQSDVSIWTKFCVRQLYLGLHNVHDNCTVLSSHNLKDEICYTGVRQKIIIIDHVCV